MCASSQLSCTPRNPSVAMAPGCLALPLQEDNPLITANDLYRKFSHSSGTLPWSLLVAKSPLSLSPFYNVGCVSEVLTDQQRGSAFTPSSGSPTSSQPPDDKWLSQVEIQTHAPPSRRLWMGPQFTFKPYQSPNTSVSNSISGADLIKTPSPPNTIIYSSSLNSSVFSNVSAQHGNGRSGEQNVSLYPTSAATECPLLDILSESSSSEMQGMALKSVNSCPLAVPGGVGGGREGREGGHVSVEPGKLWCVRITPKFGRPVGPS